MANEMTGDEKVNTYITDKNPPANLEWGSGEVAFPRFPDPFTDNTHGITQQRPSALCYVSPPYSQSQTSHMHHTLALYRSSAYRVRYIKVSRILPVYPLCQPSIFQTVCYS